MSQNWKEWPFNKVDMLLISFYYYDYIYKLLYPPENCLRFYIRWKREIPVLNMKQGLQGSFIALIVFTAGNQIILPYSQVMNGQKPMQAENSSPLIIGYYPFRAKAQIVRLLCEYLHVPYVDMLFTPERWSLYREKQAKDWVIKDLPFLIDQDQQFSMTGTSSSLHYVIEKTGRRQLLGHSLEEMVKIDSIRSKHNIRHAILGLICVTRPKEQKQETKNMKDYWTYKIEPILLEYQNECLEGNWYYGAITVVDFFIYELVTLIQQIFPQEIPKFNKLIALRNRVGSIKEIKEYESSERAIRQYHPVRYFSRFKEEKLRNCGIQTCFKPGQCPLISEFPNMQGIFKCPKLQNRPKCPTMQIQSKCPNKEKKLN